nr:alpha/beta hydrolase-fold protein [Granulicella sp. dw_53]
MPRSYATDKKRHYLVVYALHGYSIGAEQWSKEIHVPQTIEGAFAQGSQEMIVVLPDSKTVHNGSMYSSSVTSGDFEQFIAKDVVAYVDAHYRTIPNRASRGLVGLWQPIHYESVLSVGAENRPWRSSSQSVRMDIWGQLAVQIARFLC